MPEFHDRREQEYHPRPKSKSEVNGHLINDHEHTSGGAGNSARNLPSVHELHRQHDELHALGHHRGHTHEVDDSPTETARRADNLKRRVDISERLRPSKMSDDELHSKMDGLQRAGFDGDDPNDPGTKAYAKLAKQYGKRRGAPGSGA